MDFTPMRSFRIEFTDFSPVQNKPRGAYITFDNRKIGILPSAVKEHHYSFPNYHNKSKAYTYKGDLYGILRSLNDDVLMAFSGGNFEHQDEMVKMFNYITTDSRFDIEVRLVDESIIKSAGGDTVYLSKLFYNAMKAYNPQLP